MASSDDTSDYGPIKHLPGYDILETIGSGGLAVVYRACQRSLNRIVALRTTRWEQDFGDMAQCLRREAAFLACVQHPHVLSILDQLNTMASTTS